MPSNVIKLDTGIGTDDSYILCIFKICFGTLFVSGLSFFNLASQVKIAVFAHRKEDLTIKSIVPVPNMAILVVKFSAWG